MNTNRFKCSILHKQPKGTSKIISSFWLGNMKILVAFFLFALCAIQVTGKCQPDEVEICSQKHSSCFCRKCPKCPAGYGLSQQCGERYWDTTLTCNPCFKAVNYSASYSISTCQPCPQCGGKKTLHECTPSNKTLCSKNECRKGYAMNDIVEDCLPVVEPVALTTLEITKKPTTTVPPSTIQPNLQSTSNTATKQVTSQQSLKTTKSPELNNPELNLHSNRKDPNHSRDNKIIILTVFGSVAVAVLVYCLWKNKVASYFHARQKKDATKQEEEIALTSKGSTSPRTSNESLEDLWPADLRLQDIPLAGLRSKIAVKISEVSTALKGWREIGELRKLSGFDLDAIDLDGKKIGTNHGEQLFIKLGGSQPDFTLTELVSILKELERKDVVEMIQNYYRQSNTAVQIED